MATRNILLVLVILVLLSCIPSVRSGPNAYIRRFFAECWRMKGVCRPKCVKPEIYRIICDDSHVCCVKEKDLPPVVGK
ncbi:beta-defensin 135 [Carlito syrichta]|uniref:Beta-defensin n=1 Tax=Carlito syrichta TaxID=1868482 RepID=A0A3Q0DHF5_CARSF|nr:beta-defensin 135 [Carlito syrichta]